MAELKLGQYIHRNSVPVNGQQIGRTLDNIPRFQARKVGYRVALKNNKHTLTNHSEDIRVVDRAVEALAQVQVRAVENPGNRQPVVASKGMDDHGASSVPGLGRHGGVSVEAQHPLGNYLILW